MQLDSRSPMMRALLGIALTAFLAACSAAQTGPTNQTVSAVIRQRLSARVQQLYKEDCRRYGQDSNLFVRPGVLADRTSRWVRVYAETLGTNQFMTQQVEFPLIAETSGHDYEALAVAFAKPSDVHQALVFIGMPPGAVDLAKQQFWPKGERVNATIEWDGTNGQPHAVRMEDLILDTKAGKPIPALGFTFVGSAWVTEPNRPGEKAYAADVYDPMTIVSIYNESTTVLDVPRRAAKGEVYNNQMRNADVDLPKDDLVRVRLEPEYKDARRRVVDVALRLSPATTNLPIALKDLKFDLTDAKGQALQTTSDVKGMLAVFERLVTAGSDPFVTLEPDPGLALSALREAYVLVASLEQDNGIRVEPPAAGQPYFRALLPNDAYRNRANRPMQPLELYLAEHGGSVTGELHQIEESWEQNAKNATFKESHFDVPTTAALTNLLSTRKYPSVVIIFAPGTLTYGALLPFTKAIIATHPTVYIFLPAAPMPPSMPGM